MSTANETELAVQPAEMDLHLPLPGPDEVPDPCTILTYYFGFSVPEAQIGGFIYGRCQPAFALSQGGLCIFQGTDTVEPLDFAYSDYRLTMPWPEVDGNTVTFANGLRFDFIEPGVRAHITYRSPDGGTTLDLIQEAVTPLLARGHVVPGEDLHRDDSQLTGGLEQVMHVTGSLVLDGVRHDVDCYNARDRSWGQVRPEAKRAVAAPPVGWSPMYFGEDLIFNQVSFEALDTEPAWKDLYPIPADAPSHHFAWVMVDGVRRRIDRVRRIVSEHHPVLYSAMRQTVEAEDETGAIYRFTGEALAMASVPAWPNAALRVGVYRWTDGQGRVAHDTYQEMWLDDAPHKAMRERAALRRGTGHDGVARP